MDETFKPHDKTEEAFERARASFHPSSESARSGGLSPARELRKLTDTLDALLSLKMELLGATHLLGGSIPEVDENRVGAFIAKYRNLGDKK